METWFGRVPGEIRRARLIGLTPLERPDWRLADALLRQGVATAIDLGRQPGQWAETLAALSARPSLGLRLAETLAPTVLDGHASPAFLIVADSFADWRAAYEGPLFAQICSVVEARQALEAGVDGLIAKGQESGGRVGTESAFVLLQRVLALAEPLSCPVWVQGGLGLATCAAVIAGGAQGVVLDAQLALLPECSLDPAIKAQLTAMDGSEVREVAGYQVYARPGPEAAALDGLTASEVRARLAATDATRLLPVGQDAALAHPLLTECPTLETLIAALGQRIQAQFSQVRALRVLDEGSPWARAHGTRYPIAQGPMTRVSDTAEFCGAVADAGGLPFLALSLMKADAARTLLAASQARVGTKSWGVGVLGFAAPEILEPQLALIQEFRPSVVLLAGGRPSQARPLIDAGIPTYLHVPSPGLLDLFLKDGVTHFVFEGRECGGHVGPRYSFVLWEQALAQLGRCAHPERLHVLFAGGIHDARSAAMVATMAAPLAALGAKIGVLMGTAYIATEEAVSCGAIVDNFQAQALAGEDTVLVETAPGHAIRCLASGFVAHFNAEKARLKTAQVDAETAWRSLEALTVGKLRVVTKGLDYRDGKLAPVALAEQQAEGMYMLGQIVALKTERTTIAALHDEVSRGATERLACIECPEPREQAAEPIAVVGMACIYPGSPDLESFWGNILAGRDLVSEVAPERWNSALYYRDGRSGDGLTPSKWGGFIDAVPFDPVKYGIPPQSLAAIEPAQLLSLAVADAALGDAGYHTRYFDREKTAVIFGAEAGMDLTNQYTFRNLFPQYCGELPEALDRTLPKLTEDSFPGILANVISGRIANRLGLGGVNYSVDSACASSLTAIELGVKELRAGSSDMALIGGADFHNNINDFLMFASVGALSASGKCRSFDASADGICLGEGVGVVVLKRLRDAERDGDRIYAVVDGVAGSSDGKGLGLTAPRKDGQKRALERAYRQAGVLPAEVGLVEAHGTGTVVGDRTELQTLTEVFNAGGALAGQAGLGSVKSQIGHTKCAAGIAGFIKVAKALHHGILPPTRQITHPNPGYNRAASPFRLNQTAQPWVRAAKSAAVSAFGFGGTNFHAVLSAYPAHRNPLGAQVLPCELFLLRGATRAVAAGHAQALLNYLGASELPCALRDLAVTACTLGDGPVRYAFVASDLNACRAALTVCAEAGETGRDGVHVRPDGAPGKLAFLFPGQGSQAVNMLRELFVFFPAQQRWLEHDPDTAQLIFPGESFDPALDAADQAALTDTRCAQPALAMVELAAFDWLRKLGIQPAMAAGHSFGELVALSAAGAFDAPTLMGLARARAQAIVQAVGATPGAMAAVNLGSETLLPLLAEWPDVVLANHNSPRQTVLSGPTDALDAACEHLARHGATVRRLDTACAFHSPLVAGASALFAAALARVAPHPLAWPVYANSHAGEHDSTPAVLRDTLAQHLAQPVRFVEEIRAMHAAGARVFLEVGPRRVLSGLVSRILEGTPHRSIALESGKHGLADLLDATAQLAVYSAAVIDPAALFAQRARVLDLTQSPRYSATTWLVNGGRAWPRSGAAPAHAGVPALAPVVSFSAGAGSHALSAGDQPLVDYLHNMRELAHAQRDVLLRFLGAAQPPAGAMESTGRTPPPTVVAASARVALPAASARVALPATAAPAVVATTAAGHDVETILLGIVGERTGYPADMLELDLDLEADLSIDSIKRIEIVGELARALDLRGRLGPAADALTEALSSQKTLRRILARLDEALPKAPAPVGDAPGALAADALLLDIVSRSTGYPPEALDLDLDLEADLSIDSIKRLEIVGQLVARLGEAGVPEAGRDTLVEALSAQKTLRAILRLLDADAGDGVAAPTEKPLLLGVDEATDIPLARYVLHSIFAPLAEPGGRLTDTQFLISDDGMGLAVRLAELLQRQGAHVRVFDFQTTPPPTELENLDGFVHLAALNPATRVDDIKRLFSLLRSCVLGRARHILIASGLGGDFGVHFTGEREHDFVCGAGAAGLIKSLAREFPALRAHCVDLDLSEPFATLAAYLERELLADNPLNEVAYLDGHRWSREVYARALAARGELPLWDGGVVLLTGGARGITARIAMALAEQRRCHLEIVGRSPEPPAVEAEATRHIEELRQLRQTLLAAHPGIKPAEIERQVKLLLAQRQFRATLAAIQATGSTVHYTQLDVRDSVAFAAYIDALYARHGRLDGVIHGAGVIEDKLVRDKTDESFARVFDTKVSGAMTLYQQVRPDVRFVVFFSSVASAFGNRGQVDYATANDVLDKLAHAWQNRIEGRVLSVNWGPWADTGMVGEALEREYRKQGIGLIPQSEGVAALLRELAYGREGGTQVVLMCGTPASFGAQP